MKPPTAYFSAGTTMEGVKEFLESSTIHGLVYIATTRRLARLLWILIVAAGSVGAVILIQQSFSSWASSPITTTIETLPISDLDLPHLTVCPPRNSFTSLNPDLLRSRNITFDEEKRKELFDYVPYAAYDLTYKANGGEYEEFLEGERKYSDWYRGISGFELSKTRFSSTKYYDFHTAAPNGSFSTPYFGEPYNVTMSDCGLTTWVYIYVPENLTIGSKIVVDLDYEVDDDEGDFYISLQGKQTKNSSSFLKIAAVDLDKTKKKSTTKFDVAKNASEAM